MCGIAGISANPTENLPTREITKRLLTGIEHRGRDATGYAAWDGTTKIEFDKNNEAASKFINTSRFAVTNDDTTIICHTRWATKGSYELAVNNHPVAVDDNRIVGVHNGCISNDDNLFDRLDAPRIGQVDTEAIFATIAYGTDDNPYYPNVGDGTVTSTFAHIKGSAAIAWFNQDNTTPILHLARISSSPLHVARTEGGSFLFASEAAVLRKAVAGIATIVWEQSINEGTYLQIVNGTIVNEETFETTSRNDYVPTPGGNRPNLNITPARNTVTRTTPERQNDVHQIQFGNGHKAVLVIPTDLTVNELENLYTEIDAVLIDRLTEAELDTTNYDVCA